MTVIIDAKNTAPIYEQIFNQIKNQIVDGTLKENFPLPSIRGLAKDLRISFITTKRAYEELEKAGLIYTVQGKGCYVAARNPELIREESLRKIEEHIEAILDLMDSGGINRAELTEIIDLYAEDRR